MALSDAEKNNAVYFEHMRKTLLGAGLSEDEMFSILRPAPPPPVPPPGPLKFAPNQQEEYRLATDTPITEYARRLAFEFGVPNGGVLPFKFINLAVNDAGMVVVFFLGADGEPGFFKDERIGFPSKELLTKLELVRTP